VANTTTTDAAAVTREVLAQPTLARAFLRSASANADRPAVTEFGTDRSMTYGEWLARARAVAGGLSQLGVKRGERVALLLTNRLEFHVVDMGAVLLGAASFSLYNTAPVDQLLLNVDNAEPGVIVAEAQFADRARELVRLRPPVRLVVLDDALDGEMSLAALEASCPSGFDAEAAAAAVEPSDLATLVYTSGTTGAPKGVQYVHSGLMYAVRAFVQRLQPKLLGRNVSYLPMAHIAERQIGYYSAFACGMEITTLIDARRLQDALVEVRPTWFFGVPRIYEKLEAKMLGLVDDEIRAALDAAVERVRAEQAGGSPPPLTAEQAELLRPLREATGLEEAVWLGISGAPCSREMAERFHAVGLAVSEAWGMSETVIGTGAAPGKVRIGAAGWPYDGTELVLAGDGEILLRSPSVTPGYLKEPKRTRDAFTEDGFIKTGDLGRLDDDGYLWVVGRKKDIIINSAGKNMSPVAIEQAIRGTDAVISHVVCFGDGRSYNVGLIVLDPQGAADFAAAHGVPGGPVSELARQPVVREHVARVVEEGNARLSRVEQFKRFTIFEGEWPLGGDELTLTNKLKRAEVNTKYADLIDGLYAAPHTIPETAPAGG
jgi:long-subunit acyl-CoA synthetase (AMP-forming)